MCLTQEASERPTAKQLLKSPILQEVMVDLLNILL